MYCERQSGNLCRMHALNAYFGYAKISPNRFAKYTKQYDQYVKFRFGSQVNSEDHDIINNDQSCLVSYILKRHGVFAKLSCTMGNASFAFAFNSDHIWCIRYKDGQYYKIDSIEGVHPVRSMSNLTFIIPVDARAEYKNQCNAIRAILKNSQLRTIEHICLFLADHPNAFDLHVNIAVSILEMRLWISKKEWPQIKQIVARQIRFARNYKKNHKNIDAIVAHIPLMIADLTQLSLS